MNRSAKTLLANAALVVFSSVLAFVVVEAAFRVLKYRSLQKKLADHFYELALQNQNKGQSYFDPQLGYRMFPNKAWENTGGGLQNRYRVNEHGLIANDIDPRPYAVAKPADEYRIALLGDSFAASNAVYLRWSDLLEDYLNRSADWRSHVGGKRTRIINFGMSGTGFVQWGPLYEYHAHQFSPDLVIVNFITADIMRRFVYHGANKFESAADLRRMVDSIVKSRMQANLPWFAIRSEILAASGLFPKIAPQFTVEAAIAADTELFFSTQDIGINESLNSLDRVRCLAPRLILLNTPLVEELKVPEDGEQRWRSHPALRGLLGRFVVAAQGRGYSIDSALNRPRSLEEIDSWYNSPIDTHLGDYGVLVYSSAVYAYLLNWVRTPRNDPKGVAKCGA